MRGYPLRPAVLLLVASLAACGSGRGPAPADVPADAVPAPDAADAHDAPPDAREDADAAVPDPDVAADGGGEADVPEVVPDVPADVPPEEVEPCPGTCGPLGPWCADETHRGECIDADGDGPGCPVVIDVHDCPAGTECSRGECLPAPCLPDCPEMLPVPAGPFWMGCNDGTAGCPSNLLIEWCYLLNKPCHEVNVPAFRMDRFEVTKAAYKRFLAANPGAPPPHEDSWKDCIWARPEPEYDQHPVNCVDWRQADAYCRWAGGGRRLCTEAEWEKAARGTDGRRYPWGNQPPTCELAVIGQGGEAGLGCGTGMTWPVGSKPLGASAYRIEDMAGNVWEWVADCFTWITGSGIPGYEGAPTDGSAVLDCESEVDPVRIQRGGAFHLDPADAIQLSVLTAYWRSGSLELGWSWLDGFRCCRSR